MEDSAVVPNHVVPKPESVREAVGFLTMSELSDAPLWVGVELEGRVFLRDEREYLQFTHGLYVATFENHYGSLREIWWVCNDTGKSAFVTTGVGGVKPVMHFHGWRRPDTIGVRQVGSRKYSVLYNVKPFLTAILDQLLQPVYWEDKWVRLLASCLISYEEGTLELEGDGDTGASVQ